MTTDALAGRRHTKAGGFGFDGAGGASRGEGASLRAHERQHSHGTAVARAAAVRMASSRLLGAARRQSIEGAPRPDGGGIGRSSFVTGAHAPASSARSGRTSSTGRLAGGRRGSVTLTPRGRARSGNRRASLTAALGLGAGRRASGGAGSRYDASVTPAPTSDPVILPSDPSAALERAAPTQFAAGSALLTLLPLSARTTTKRLRALTEIMLRRKRAAEQELAEATSRAAAQDAAALAAGLDPSKSLGALVAELRAKAAAAKSFKAAQSAARRARQNRSAYESARPAEAAGEDGGAAASDARASRIAELRSRVFELRRRVGVSRADQAMLGRMALRGAGRLEDAKTTVAFVVTERRAAEDEVQEAKRAWALSAAGARRLFPVVVATSAQLHDILDAAARHTGAEGDAVMRDGAAAGGAGPESGAGRPLMSVIQRIAEAQRDMGDAAPATGMVRVLFSALGWGGAAAAPGADGGPASGTGGGVSDTDGDLIRFVDELEGGSAGFFSSSSTDAGASASRSVAAGADGRPWEERRAAVFETLRARADKLLQEQEAAREEEAAAAAARRRERKATPTSAGGKGRRAAGSASRAAAAKRKQEAEARADEASSMARAGLSAASKSLAGGVSAGAETAANAHVAAEALAWSVLLFAAPSALAAAIAASLPAGALRAPGAGKRAALDASIDLVAWARDAAAAPAAPGPRPSPAVTAFIGSADDAGPGWALARAPWLELPPHLDRAAMSDIRAFTGRGAPPAMARFNRSVALQELDAHRAGGAPSRLLLDWLLACASCNNNESDFAGVGFDGVSGVPGLLGHVTAPESALPARSAGALGVASAEADSVWGDVGRHIVGAGAASPASGPDPSTRAVPASVLAALALTFPLQFAREVMDKGTAAGIIRHAPTGRKSTRTGALPGGMELDADAAAAASAGGLVDGPKRDELVAEAAARAVIENSASTLGVLVAGVVPKTTEALPSVVTSATFAADVVAARQDTVTDVGGAGALVRALNVARGRALGGGGGFAASSSAMTCPSSYLVPTPAAMLELRSQFSRADDLHSALFDGLADTLARLDAGADADDAAVDAEVARLRRGGIPLSHLRVQAPEIFSLLMSVPEFTDLAVAIRPSAPTTVESERLAAAVVMAHESSPRQAVRVTLGRMVEQADADSKPAAAASPSLGPAADADAKPASASTASLAAALPAMAFAADTAELLLDVVPALIEGKAMAGPGLGQARVAVVALLRPDLCVVTREAFAEFMTRVASKSNVGPRLDDAAARAHLRFATPSQAMLDALAAQAAGDGALEDWPAEPVDVVPNTYVSLLFLLARAVGFLLANPPTADGAAARRAEAIAAAVRAAAAGDDPALSFTAWRRTLRSGASVDEAARRLALVRAMDRRDDEADASAVGGKGVQRGPAAHSKDGWGSRGAAPGAQKRRPGDAADGGASAGGGRDREPAGGDAMAAVGAALSPWTWGGGCVPAAGAGRRGEAPADSAMDPEDPAGRDGDVSVMLRALAGKVDSDGDPVAAADDENPADFVPGQRTRGEGRVAASGSATAPPSVAMRVILADMEGARGGGGAVQQRGLTTREEDAVHADLDEVERRAADLSEAVAEDEQRRRKHAAAWSDHDIRRMGEEAAAAKKEADRRAANPDHEVPGSEIRAACSGGAGEGGCAVM